MYAEDGDRLAVVALEVRGQHLVRVRVRARVRVRVRTGTVEGRLRVRASSR